MEQFFNIKNKCPLLASKYFEVEDDYIKIAQPMTAIEIYLTGDTKYIWTKIEENEGKNIESILKLIQNDKSEITVESYIEIINKLVALSIITVTEENDLYNITELN